MAKKKKRNVKKKDFMHKNELIAIILVLIAVLGLGKYGPVGKMFTSFSIFLVGSLYMPLLVVLLLVGGYTVIKREWPDFFSTKFIGLYLFVIGLLVLMHREFIITGSTAMVIFQKTSDQLVAQFNSIMNTGIVDTFYTLGGGIIGGSFAILFNSLFSFMGMQIIATLIIIIGFTLFSGFSVLEFIREKVDTPKKEKTSKNDKEKEVVAASKLSSVKISNGDEVVSDEVKDSGNHIKISSIDELTKVKDTPSTDVVVKNEEVEEKEETRVERPMNTSYFLPSIDMLDKPKKGKKVTDQSGIERNIVIVEQVLKDFGIVGKVVEVHVGPTVTQYELEIKSGTKVNKIVSLNKEISLALAKKDVRIQAPIPGKSTVGLEIPNDEVAMVSFRETLEKVPESKKDSKLLVPLGKNIMGNVIWCEIDKTPHLLVAGATGSGKSVCINGIICSILMRARPDEVKLVMVDPKKVELSGYNGIPHLMAPVVTDPKKASIALAKIVVEMERRYDVFEKSRTKNISTYNAYIDKENEKLHDDEKMARMPYIVVIVDELADLMLVASKDVEASILRITQMARAAGIHLIIATQRPSTDVITGVVKANVPSRIAFTVSSGIDSRTILDQTGAEKLLGKGDMLFLPMGEMASQRVQGAYISDDEIKRLIDYTVKQQVVQYDDLLANLDSVSNGDKSSSQVEDMNQEENYDDPLYNEIVQFVIESQKASASLLQRRFKLGYNRAARIIDLLEDRGIIGGQNGSKPREVLVQLESSEEE